MGIRRSRAGRNRGPAQAAFTNPELLELGEMDEVDVIVEEQELERALAVQDESMDPTAQRNVKVLREYAAKRLEGRGLLRREPDPHDGRATNAFPITSRVPRCRRATSSSSF